jgi:hypothetical protein
MFYSVAISGPRRTAIRAVVRFGSVNHLLFQRTTQRPLSARGAGAVAEGRACREAIAGPGNRFEVLCQTLVSDSPFAWPARASNNALSYHDNTHSLI